MVSWYWGFAIKMQTKCFETFTGIALIYGSHHGSHHGSREGLLNAEGGNAPLQNDGKTLEAEKLDGWADDLKLGLEREIKKTE